MSLPRKIRHQAQLLLADGTALLERKDKPDKAISVADHRLPVFADEPTEFKFGGSAAGQTSFRVNNLPIDHAVRPPPIRGGEECAKIARPCNRYACEFHLWPQDERPGRPHSLGARPPVQLKVLQHSCMYDVIRDGNPDGLTADEVGSHFGVVGERILQVENRAILKRKAVERVWSVVETLRGELSDAQIVSVEPHNENRLPHHHFVTIKLEARAPVPLRHAVGRVVVELVDLSAKMEPGQELVDLMIHQDGARSGAVSAALTVAIRVREQTAKNVGVSVRRKK